jgi:hypothetical protein
MKIKDVRNNLTEKTSREELFDDGRRRCRSANPRVRATRGGRKPRMVARAGADRRSCRWRRARLNGDSSSRRRRRRHGGGGGAAKGGCAGAGEAAARARERQNCRARRWHRRGGGLRRAAAANFRRARARWRRIRELYGADEEKEGEHESLYEGLDPLVTR